MCKFIIIIFVIAMLARYSDATLLVNSNFTNSNATYCLMVKLGTIGIDPDASTVSFLEHVNTIVDYCDDKNAAKIRLMPDSIIQDYYPFNNMNEFHIFIYLMLWLPSMTLFITALFILIMQVSCTYYKYPRPIMITESCIYMASGVTGVILVHTYNTNLARHLWVHSNNILFLHLAVQMNMITIGVATLLKALHILSNRFYVWFMNLHFLILGIVLFEINETFGEDADSNLSMIRIGGLFFIFAGYLPPFERYVDHTIKNNEAKWKKYAQEKIQHLHDSGDSEQRQSIQEMATLLSNKDKTNKNINNLKSRNKKEKNKDKEKITITVQDFNNGKTERSELTIPENSVARFLSKADDLFGRYLMVLVGSILISIVLINDYSKLTDYFLIADWTRSSSVTGVFLFFAYCGEIVVMIIVAILAPTLH
jgi:lysylphosphatidylglycerol synthetase-like protein (DUF2156 family)